MKEDRDEDDEDSYLYLIKGMGFGRRRRGGVGTAHPFETKLKFPFFFSTVCASSRDVLRLGVLKESRM